MKSSAGIVSIIFIMTIGVVGLSAQPVIAIDQDSTLNELLNEKEDKFEVTIITHLVMKQTLNKVVDHVFARWLGYNGKTLTEEEKMEFHKLNKLLKNYQEEIEEAQYDYYMFNKLRKNKESTKEQMEQAYNKLKDQLKDLNMSGALVKLQFKEVSKIIIKHKGLST